MITRHLLLCLLLPLVWCAHAQDKPFPQNVTYSRGFQPTNFTAAAARQAYENWKAHYLKSDCGPGLYRVEFTEPMGTTVSEGMGYGMLLTAYFGEKTYFDGLWAFAKKNWNQHGMMGWKVDCHGFIASAYGSGVATDGDLDMALALCVAADQWGNDYKTEAVGYIRKLKTLFKRDCAGRWIQMPGDYLNECWGNTSYWDPGYYRVFCDFTGDQNWLQIAADTYTILRANRHPATGLIANECDAEGKVHKNYPFVDYNGCRIPWRIGTDYLWFGTPDAKNICDKISDWADATGITNLVDGYNVDGTPSPGKHWTQSSPWIGGWTCGAMAKNQDRVNRFAAHFKSCNFEGYYDQSLRTLYLLTLTGNFWKPTLAEVGKAQSSGSIPVRK